MITRLILIAFFRCLDQHSVQREQTHDAGDDADHQLDCVWVNVGYQPAITRMMSSTVCATSAAIAMPARTAKNPSMNSTIACIILHLSFVNVPRMGQAGGLSPARFHPHRW